MTEREKRIEEMAEMVEVFTHGVCSTRQGVVDALERGGYCDIKNLYEAGYRRVEEGDIIVHKDSSKRTVEELEFFIKHNEKVRKDAIGEFFVYVVRFTDGRTQRVGIEDLKEVARKVFGVEVEE